MYDCEYRGFTLTTSRSRTSNSRGGLFSNSFISSNVVYILIFATLELCLCFDAASQFTRADGKLELSQSFSTAGGAFAFASSILGYYTVLHYLCQESLPFSVPVGDTSRFFVKRARVPGKGDGDFV